jgi:DNA-binding GntR family transcriptional regulator
MSGVAERVYDHLRAGIVAGNLKVGDHLREVEIATALGTSRTPVREAMRRLAAEGLVVLGRNTGGTVAAYSHDDAREIFWMRATLEGHAAARAAQRIQAAEIAALHALCDRMEAAAETAAIDLVAFSGLNTAFHVAIASASRSTVLLRQIQALLGLPLALFHTQGWRAELPHAAGFAQHRDLVRALELGRPQLAEAQMRAHILAAAPEPGEEPRETGAGGGAQPSPRSRGEDVERRLPRGE